mgnify:CR=1 FL=1
MMRRLIKLYRLAQRKINIENMEYKKNVKVKKKASRAQKKTKIKAIRASGTSGADKRTTIKKERVLAKERKTNIKKIAKLKKK